MTRLWHNWILCQETWSLFWSLCSLHATETQMPVGYRMWEHLRHHQILLTGVVLEIPVTRPLTWMTPAQCSTVWTMVAENKKTWSTVTQTLTQLQGRTMLLLAMMGLWSLTTLKMALEVRIFFMAIDRSVWIYAYNFTDHLNDHVVKLSMTNVGKLEVLSRLSHTSDIGNRCDGHTAGCLVLWGLC